MTDTPNIQQAIAALNDPALADQNAVLGTVQNEIAASKGTLKEFDRIISEMQIAKVKEKRRLAVLEKRAKVFRRAVFDLSNITMDAVE